MSLKLGDGPGEKFELLFTSDGSLCAARGARARLYDRFGGGQFGVGARRGDALFRAGDGYRARGIERLRLFVKRIVCVVIFRFSRFRVFADFARLNNVYTLFSL